MTSSTTQTATRADAELLATLILRGAEKMKLEGLEQIKDEYAGTIYDDNDEILGKGLCAMGAAFYAKGKQLDAIADADPSWIPASSRYLPNLKLGNPFHVETLHDYVVYLNDRRGLSFQDIAKTLRELDLPE